MDKSDHLMEGFRAGDEVAFRQIMTEYLHALTFHVYKICKHKEAAEEIVSDTFSKLWERRESFQTETNIKAFLYIAARNATLDYIRSSEYKRSHSQTLIDPNFELEEALIMENDPLTHLIHAELIQSLIREVDRLPERQKEVFRMLYFEQLDIDEVCTSLNISPNAVYIAKKKALVTLRKVFSDQEWILLLLLFSF